MQNFSFNFYSYLLNSEFFSPYFISKITNLKSFWWISFCEANGSYFFFFFVGIYVELNFYFSPIQFFYFITIRILKCCTIQRTVDFYLTKSLCWYSFSNRNDFTSPQQFISRNFLKMSYGDGLCGCFSDCGICLYGLFCCPCLNGQNHAKIRNEDCNICHVCNITSEYWIRKHMLSKSGESTDNDVIDCLVANFCFPLAVCQDARGLKWNKMFQSIFTLKIIKQNNKNNLIFFFFLFCFFYFWLFVDFYSYAFIPCLFQAGLSWDLKRNIIWKYLSLYKGILFQYLL